MPSMPRIAWRAVFVQGTTIVTSILLALAVNAWWASRLATQSEGEHLQALQRDFRIASTRLDASIAAARQGHDESLALVMALAQDKLKELGRQALHKASTAMSYEVYSAPDGAWATIVSAGEVDQLQSQELKLQIADLYGGLEDLRVSEHQLLEQVIRFQSSEVFATKIGMGDIGYSAGNPDAPMGPAALERVASWHGDRLLENWFALLAVHHSLVLEDYDFLSTRVDRVLQQLEAELRRF